MSISKHKLAIVLNSTGWGGLEMNTLKLAKELLRNGVEVYHIVNRESRYAQEIEGEFDYILHLNSPKKYFDFKNAKILWNHLKENEIQNVFVSFRADLDLVAIAKRKSMHTIHVIHQQHMLMGITKTGITQRYRYRAIDIWLCPLEILKPDVLVNTQVPESKIRIAPIGIHIEFFLTPKHTKSEAQKILGCETNAKLIGVFGRIELKKRQLFLIEAIKKLRELGEDVELLIVGMPTLNDPNGTFYFNELKTSIENNELTKAVRFVSFTDDVTICFAAIDFLAMPSECETYGMVTLEAMLSKVPVIGTNSGGTPEILDFGKYGELYEVDQIDSFIEHFKTLNLRIETGDLNLDIIQNEIAEKYNISKEVIAVMDAMV